MTGSRPPFRPQGVVFDLDGVLIDSEPAWESAEREVAQWLALDWTADRRAASHGRSNLEVARDMARWSGNRERPEAIADRILDNVLDAVRREMKLMPGAMELVRELHPHVPLAVATNSVSRFVEVALSQGGLRQFFDVVIASEDVSAPKPAPDSYLEACARLGVPSEQAVGIDDSVPGVRSAQSAGLWVVGRTESRGFLEQAHQTTGSLEELVGVLVDWL